MIQFNLLPDVKIKYIKARRQKRMVMLAAFVVGAGSLAVLAMTILYVYGVQGAQIASLDKSIKTHTASINQKNGQVDDIGKVLTVQSQLTSLDTLHAENSRGFPVRLRYCVLALRRNARVRERDFRPARHGLSQTVWRIRKFF